MTYCVSGGALNSTHSLTFTRISFTTNSDESSDRAVRATYDALQVFSPPRRAGEPGRRVDSVETVRHVTFDDLASIVRLAGQRHLCHSFGMQIANVRLLFLAFPPYIRGYLAPANATDSGRDPVMLAGPQDARPRPGTVRPRP